jgi:hypothetical protein
VTLLGASLAAQSASIVAGSGATPPASATGIYEVARVTTDAGKVQKALALVHKGTVKEVHSRSTTRYQVRASGSSPVRVTTVTYNKLLTAAGGTNRDVNAMPLQTRCQFYQLAGLSTAGMNCPTSAPPPPTTAPTGSTCPMGYELQLRMVDGRKQMVCVLATQVPLLPDDTRRFAWRGSASQSLRQDLTGWLQRLSPIADAEARLLQLEFKWALFTNPVSFGYYSPEAGQLEHGGWRFDGIGFSIIWANDPP